MPAIDRTRAGMLGFADMIRRSYVLPVAIFIVGYRPPAGSSFA
jgi:hypothetical protein